MKADTETQKQVTRTLEEFTDAYAVRDLDRFLACFSSDGDVVIYGTGPDEKRLGLDQIRTQVARDWSQSESASITFQWTAISSSGVVAWVAADGFIHFRVNNRDGSIPVRMTFVLENHDGAWLIVQSHFSIPASDQEADQSF